MTPLLFGVEVPVFVQDKVFLQGINSVDSLYVQEKVLI